VRKGQGGGTTSNGPCLRSETQSPHSRYLEPAQVAAGCLGFLLGVIRWRTGNTTAAIVVHATINFAAATFFTAMILLAAWIL
jgi:membrane protease YdiL (CAAX protease family)